MRDRSWLLGSVDQSIKKKAEDAWRFGPFFLKRLSTTIQNPKSFRQSPSRGARKAKMCLSVLDKGGRELVERLTWPFCSSTRVRIVRALPEHSLKQREGVNTRDLEKERKNETFTERKRDPVDCVPCKVSSFLTKRKKKRKIEKKRANIKRSKLC